MATVFSPPVWLGGQCGLQQSRGGAGSDHILVGRVGQVDSLHSDLWRGGDVTGETLPQTEVSEPELFMYNVIMMSQL